MPMGMLGNKSFTQVLLDKGGVPMAGQDDGLDDEFSKSDALNGAMKEFMSAIKGENVERAVRAFKIVKEMCEEEYAEEDESSKESVFKESEY